MDASLEQAHRYSEEVCSDAACDLQKGLKCGSQGQDSVQGSPGACLLLRDGIIFQGRFILHPSPLLFCLPLSQECLSSLASESHLLSKLFALFPCHFLCFKSIPFPFRALPRTNFMQLSPKERTPRSPPRRSANRQDSPPAVYAPLSSLATAAEIRWHSSVSWGYGTTMPLSQYCFAGRALPQPQLC